jgi:methylmalonyl-CoA mutase N-terminal domain/subunit
VFHVDPSIEAQQIERLRSFRASRRAAEYQPALDAVAHAARSSDNLMPVVIAAVEARATLGEISDALRRVFGEYQDTSNA